MIAKHLEKINSLLNRAKTEAHSASDSVALISTNMARTASTQAPRSQTRSFVSRKAPRRKTSVGKPLERILLQLFKAKCKDLQIEFNKNSWELFLKTFSLKNPIVEEKISVSCLDLGNLSLTPSCLPWVNSLIDMSRLKSVVFSRNRIDPTQVYLLRTMQQLHLNNCKLGNDILQVLFQQLMDSPIVKISLSSPDLKDRNQLTRYGQLIQLIKESKSLETLLLSNIEIQPDSGILQATKGAKLKHLDLSDNTDVKGMSPTLISLNLSRNGISSPFQLPLPACHIQTLNLSCNKIPYYCFKSFLKTTYFGCLDTLILDHIQLNGPIYPLQQFLEQTFSLRYLSMIDCDLAFDSFNNVVQGTKASHSLRSLDLSRNRVAHTKLAEKLSEMLQSGPLLNLKMRHCDLKDELGATMLNGLHKSCIKSLNLMNNLLGDETARVLCFQLKQTRTVTEVSLDQNIIKYKDQEEIDSYLSSNRFHSKANLFSQYRQLSVVNRQEQEVNKQLQQEDSYCQKLREQTNELEKVFIDKFRVCNEHKKQLLLHKIERIRQRETSVQQQLFIRDTLLVPSSTASPALRHNIDSMCEFNPELINIASPRQQ